MEGEVAWKEGHKGLEVAAAVVVMEDGMAVSMVESVEASTAERTAGWKVGMAESMVELAEASTPERTAGWRAALLEAEVTEGPAWHSRQMGP